MTNDYSKSLNDTKPKLKSNPQVQLVQQHTQKSDRERFNILYYQMIFE